MNNSNSLNFTKIFLDDTRRKLSKTYRKSQSRDTFRYRTFAEHNEEASLILKSMGLTEYESGWETYRINALYNYSDKRSDLYKYQELLAYKVRDTILESDDDEFKSVEIAVQLEKFPATAFTPKDSPALKVSIISAPNISGDCFVLLRGFLLSVERHRGLRENERLNNKATILPLVLVTYDHKIFLQSFRDFLEENFSCLVSPLKFSSRDLKWIFTLFNAPGGENETMSTSLEYRTPFEELKCIEYIIDAESVSKAWKRVLKPTVREITEDHVKEFISILENEFYAINRIHLSRLELCAVKTSVGVCKTYGETNLKIKDSSRLYSFMRFLTHLSQEY